MKSGKTVRVITLLLSAVLIAGTLAACNTEDDTSKPDESAAQSSAEQSSEAAVSTEPNAYAEAIDAAYKEELPKNAEYVNILGGMQYTISRESYKHFPDDGVKLTDNVIAGIDDESQWVGFLGKDDVEITVDLGGKQTGLAGFAVNFLYRTNPGRGIPSTVKLFISDNGTDYLEIADAYKYPYAPASTQVFTQYAYTQRCFEASYIKIVITDFTNLWNLIDNIQLFRAVEGEEEIVEEYYDNEPLPTDVKAEYWSSSDSDYSKAQNLLLGLPQRVYNGVSLADEVKTDYYNTPASSTLLTDGKSGAGDFMGSTYFHVSSGYSRTFIYDLTKLSAVDSATVGFYNYAEYGITGPVDITVQVSENAADWQTVYYGATLSSDPNGYNTFKCEFDGDKPYRARFVKFLFTVTSHCWLDELTVSGKKDTAGAVAVVPDKGEVVQLGYPTPDKLGGCNNILLAYNYQTSSPEVGRTDKDGYLPYVGYFDRTGKLQDYFFDSYLYLPCSTTCPSGGKLFCTNDYPSIMTDWLDYENDLFYEDRNVNALEEAVGEISDELGDSDYQAKVFLSIFCPATELEDFGDVDGDGVTENMTVLEDRIKVIKWWIDRQITRYEACNFKNQKLVGFYWYDESVTMSDGLIKGSLDFAVDYVHSLGYYIVWIPYYQASGFTYWKDAGFDVANMQPNYMFNEGYTEKVLYDNAMLTNVYGMGVEIEIDGKAITTDEYYARYMAYLYAGVKTGYMNGIKMYYQDAGPGVYYRAYKSADSRIRAIYDNTYSYAKGTLKIELDVDAERSFTVKKGETLKDEIVAETGIVADTNIGLSPKYGKAGAAGDGRVAYIPAEGFVGTDTFTVVVTNGITSVNVVYTVTVTD